MDEENKNQPSEAEEKLAKVEKERDDYLSGWQRAKADFINYKKEEFVRLEEMAKYSSEDLLTELITVMDNFDLALSYAAEKKPIPSSASEPRSESGGVEKGIYMIRAQIEDVLKKRGLEKLDVKINTEFNPSIAEAIVEVESESPPGQIVEIIEPGYALNGKIIRHARVKVSKNRN